MMKKIILFAAILLSGCTTIHFDRNATIDLDATKTEKWHHNALLALVEVSEPVNLTEECGEQAWSSVKTELSFVNGLLSGIVNQFAPLWYPKTVTISCK
jgi:hypothetical protein